MKCKIQTMSVKTNIRVSFTPPEVTNEDFVKMLYYHHQDFTMCQRVVEISMDEESKKIESDFSKLRIKKIVPKNSFVVYGYDYSQGVYEVEIHTNPSLLQKFEKFIEKIPPESTIAFIHEKNYLFPLFVKAFLRRLGRKPPIDAENDGELVKK